ncbi:MAG TPA: DHA2 family efflux MFS transporter permease subunit [Candidatus Acidoferrales bacterium]|nr:DHA2 family efflux MFS transporter permease subunit [Candidatus Acidoferrales bacterium]
MAAVTLPAAVLPLHDEAYRNRWIIAITVTFASILEILDTSIVNVAIPHMMGTLGATLDEIAWVSTGYIVANVIVLPITGWLSAYFGRQRYFAGSIALFTLASFFCGSAHSLTELVMWRIVQGLGGGALLSTSQAILYEVFPPHEYGQAMAIFGVGVMVGPTLGPTLGGYITDTFSWPWIFYINLPFGVAAFLLSVRYIRNSRFAQKVGSTDWLGLLLLAAGIGTLQTLLERGERQDWFASREIVTYAVVSAASLVTFVWHELTTRHPVIDLRILANRQFATGALLGGMLGVCLYATVFVLPVYLQQIQQFTANQTGLVILPGALASAVAMVVMARTLGRIDARMVASLGALIFAFAMWQWSHFTTQSGFDDFFWPLILRGAALGLVFVPLNNLAMLELPMNRIAAATGLYNLMRQLGGSVGIALSATFVARYGAQTRAALAEHVSLYDPVTVSRLDAATHALLQRGETLALARAQALAGVAGEVGRQSAMLSFERIFLVFGVIFLFAIPLVLTLRWNKGRTRGGVEAH